MRPTKQELPQERNLRRKDWKRYAGDLGGFFEHSFELGNRRYRIDGWIDRNPVYKICVTREDGARFAMSVEEIETDTTYFHAPNRGR